MQLHSLLAGIFSAIALTACASQAAPPPAVPYDAAAFKPAAIQADPPKPMQVVTVPAPLPLPGQLQPPPSVKRAPRGTAAKRVADANAAALEEPSAHRFINAVQVYPYTEGALYRLYAAPEQVTDIALQPGETLSSVSAGDIVRWVVGDTTSGAADGKQTHVLVKPSVPGLKTNLVIMTDRRSYHLALESTDRTAMAVISWTYPQDQLFALQRKAKAVDDAAPIASGVALENLHFRYAITGDNPPWRPERVFDDGQKVFVAFPARIDQGEAPPLFVVGPAGDSQLVNYRVRGAYYIVDRLFAAAELRLGQKPQQVVRITRTDAGSATAKGRKG
ncbi:MAG: P-type conjugative transfer protein TrbG [Caulobacteraceae bacterium]